MGPAAVQHITLDSIAASLSTKSIRRQDPNTYSDTEVRALSSLPLHPKMDQITGTLIYSFVTTNFVQINSCNESAGGDKLDLLILNSFLLHNCRIKYNPEMQQYMHKICTKQSTQSAWHKNLDKLHHLFSVPAKLRNIKFQSSNHSNLCAKLQFTPIHTWYLSRTPRTTFKGHIFLSV